MTTSQSGVLDAIKADSDSASGSTRRSPRMIKISEAHTETLSMTAGYMTNVGVFWTNAYMK